MEELTLPIVGSKKVSSVTDDNGVTKDHYRVGLRMQDGTVLNCKANEQPTANGAVVQIYEKGDQPDWAATPLEKQTGVIQLFCTIDQLKNAKSFFDLLKEL